MFLLDWLFLPLVCSWVVFKKSFSLPCQRKIKAEPLHLPRLADWHFVLQVPIDCKEKYLNTSNSNVNLSLLKNIVSKSGKIILRDFWGRIWANQIYLIFFGRDCKFCLGLLWLRIVGDGLHPHLSVNALQSWGEKGKALKHWHGNKQLWVWSFECLLGAGLMNKASPFFYCSFLAEPQHPGGDLNSSS